MAGLLAIFYLPYHVPLPPTASYSYAFGYNNRAGIVLLLLLVAIGAIWTKGAFLPATLPGESRPVSRKTLAFALLVVLAGCLAMWLVAGRFGGFGESSYEIDRVGLTAQGKLPYVDFEWPFGVSFLYLPLLLKRLFAINLYQAANLFWTINFLIGTVLLFVSVNLIDYPTRARRSIFLLMLGAGLPAILTMGTHYTFLRYTLPIFFILVIQKTARRGGVPQQLLAAATAVAGTVIQLTISPETAIALAFASACVLLPHRETRTGPGLAVYAGLLLADLVAFGLALKLHVFDTVRASGGGADSLPIILSPHVVLFFIALFVCGCYVYRRFTQPGIVDNTFGLIAFSLPMLAAALGRDDPMHVIWNGEGVLLASLFYLSNQKIVWPWCKASFAIILILLPGLTGIWFYQQEVAILGLNIIDEEYTPMSRSLNSLARRYIASHGNAAQQAKWNDRLTNPNRFSVPDRIDFASLYPTWHGGFAAPFGYVPNGLGTYLSPEIDYGHYKSTENASTLAAIHAKIAEMDSQPSRALLLPDGFEVQFCVANAQNEQAALSILFSTVYRRRVAHPESVLLPICDHILAYYRMQEAPTRQNFHYGLWVRSAQR